MWPRLDSYQPNRPTGHGPSRSYRCRAHDVHASCLVMKTVFKASAHDNLASDATRDASCSSSAPTRMEPQVAWRERMHSILIFPQYCRAMRSTHVRWLSYHGKLSNFAGRPPWSSVPFHLLRIFKHVNGCRLQNMLSSIILSLILR